LSLDEKVNGDLNKVRVDVQVDEPTTGHMQIVEIVDLNKQVFTSYFPSYKFCKKYSFPFKLNIKDLWNTMERKLYLGLAQKYYTFDIEKEATQTFKQTIFFDETTRNIVWGEVEGQPFVLAFDSVTEQTFPDSTFEVPECDSIPIEPFPGKAFSFNIHIVNSVSLHCEPFTHPHNLILIAW
jgi:hypothetical protein